MLRQSVMALELVSIIMVRIQVQILQITDRILIAVSIASAHSHSLGVVYSAASNGAEVASNLNNLKQMESVF